MTLRRTAATTAALTLAVTAAATAAPAHAGNPNNGEKLAQAVTADAIMDHLQTLQDIALKYEDHRAAGGPGYEESAQYVESVLQGAGYTTERQYFTFETANVVEDTLRVNTPTLQDIVNAPMSYSPSTPTGGITADLAAPTTATGCDAAAYDGADVAGKIALVSRGTCSFGQKSATAAEAGALGVIVYNNTDGALNGTLGASDPAYVPTTGITLADGQALLAQMASGPVNVTLDLQIVIEEVETFNILAETATGRDDNVVMLGAHLDSVAAGPGINDNASGAATVLETAVQMADAKKLNNKVRFAFWGAEELGLLGSWHYIEDLAANDPAELEDIAAYLNYDMLGSPNYIIGVYDANESTYPAPVTVPAGSAALEAVYTDYFDSINQPWVDTEFSGRSDYQAFIEAGIPSSGLFTGGDGQKTADEVAMFGGLEGVDYDPSYHTPADNLDNISVEALDIMSDAVAYSAMELAMDTSAVNGKQSAGKSGKVKPGQGPKGVAVESTRSDA